MIYIILLWKSMIDGVRRLTAMLLISCMLLAGCSGEADGPIEIVGCMDEKAENYDENATLEGPCTYSDSDGDGIFDIDEVPGCTDNAANNFVPEATDDDGSCDYWVPKYTETWTKHDPEDEDCMCSDGSEYSFYSRDGDSDVAVLFFNGGGACWNDFTCTVENSSSTGAYWQNPTGWGGILDLDNRNNPLIDASMVFVPYCTGDVHMGNTTLSYGDNVMHHRGYPNAMSAFDYFISSHPNASTYYVLGSSGGAIAAGFYAGSLSEAIPEANIFVFHDSTGGVTSTGTTDLYPAWGLNNTSFTWLDGLTYNGSSLDWNDMTSAHLDIFLNMYDPDITYGRFDSAQDETMKYFNGLLNNPPEDYNWRLRNSELHIESEGVEMSGWIESGDNHGILFSSWFYQLEDESVSFSDWFTSWLNGEMPEDVWCTDC